MVDRLTRLAAALASLLLVTGITQEARAASQCGPLADITGQLSSKYHEAPAARAISANGYAVILFAAPDGATWTFVGIPAGHPEIGCVLDAGKAWQAAEPPPAGKPS